MTDKVDTALLVKTGRTGPFIDTASNGLVEIVDPARMNSIDIDIFRESARLAWNEGDFDQAILLYDEIVQTVPGDLEARRRLAEMLAWHGKYRRAKSEYKKVCRIMPETEVAIPLAQISSWDGDYHLAYTLYKDILSREPENFDAVFGLGQIYHWSGNYERAYRYYQRALGLNSESDEVREAMAQINRLYYPALEFAYLSTNEHKEIYTRTYQTGLTYYLIRNLNLKGLLTYSDLISNSESEMAEAGVIETEFFSPPFVFTGAYGLKEYLSNRFFLYNFGITVRDIDQEVLLRLNHADIPQSLRAIRGGINYNQVQVYLYHYEGIKGQADFSRYSDGNERWHYFIEYKPRVLFPQFKCGLRYEYDSFRDTSEIYWSPIKQKVLAPTGSIFYYHSLGQSIDLDFALDCTYPLYSKERGLRDAVGWTYGADLTLDCRPGSLALKYFYYHSINWSIESFGISVNIRF